MNKNKYIRIRLTPGEKEAIEEAATSLGVTVTKLVRDRVLVFSSNINLNADGELDTKTVMKLDAARTSQILKNRKVNTPT